MNLMLYLFSKFVERGYSQTERFPNCNFKRESTGQNMVSAFAVLMINKK